MEENEVAQEQPREESFTEFLFGIINKHKLLEIGISANEKRLHLVFRKKTDVVKVCTAVIDAKTIEEIKNTKIPDLLLKEIIIKNSELLSK